MTEAPTQQRKRYTIADVRRAYDDRKRREELYGEWAAAVIYRPLSFLITPWFLNRSVRATSVTILSLVIVASFPVLVMWGGASGYLFLALGGFVFGLLDCVDGNIARATGTQTSLGQYADFVADIIFRIVFYISIAMIVSRSPGAPEWIAAYALAAGSAWFAVAARLSRIYIEHRLGGRNPSARPESGDGGGAMTVGNYVFAFFSGLDSLIAPIVLVVGYFDGLSWFLLWLLVFSAADFLHTQITAVRNLKA